MVIGKVPDTVGTMVVAHNLRKLLSPDLPDKITGSYV